MTEKTIMEIISDHGLSEPEGKEPDAIKDIIDTITSIYTGLGEIDLLNEHPGISDLCTKCGVECLHLRIVAKELREGL